MALLVDRQIRIGNHFLRMGKGIGRVQQIVKVWSGEI